MKLRAGAVAVGVALAALAWLVIFPIERIKPEPARAMTAEGRISAAADALDAGDIAGAREVFLDLYPHPGATLGLGIVARMQGDLPGSLACLSELPPCEDLAFTLYAMDLDAEAAGVFGQILDPADPLSFVNLGAALHHAGFDAAGLFEAALSMMDPGTDEAEPDALLGLARAIGARQGMEVRERMLAQAAYLQELAHGQADGGHSTSPGEPDQEVNSGRRRP